MQLCGSLLDPIQLTAKPYGKNQTNKQTKTQKSCESVSILIR